MSNLNWPPEEIFKFKFNEDLDKEIDNSLNNEDKNAHNEQIGTIDIIR